MRRIGFFVLMSFILGIMTACGGGDAQESSQDESETTPRPSLTPNVEVVVAQNTLDPRANLAAEVNGEAITIPELEKQIAFYEAGTSSEAADQNALVGSVLERLIEEELITQAAVAMDIVISDEAVQAEIDVLQAEAEAQGITVDAFFAAQGISPEDYPERLRHALLTEAVNDVVTASVPSTTTQVRARHILVDDEASALDVLELLEAGNDFAQLAADYSLDPSTREAGGDLGWISPGDLLQPEVEATIFSLPANSRAPEPIQSILGYHVIESIERDDNRPLDPARYAEQRQNEWARWLDEQRNQAIIIRYVGPFAGQ